MFMTEYMYKKAALEKALVKNRNARIVGRNNPTSPEMHKLKKEYKELNKALRALEDQYWC